MPLFRGYRRYWILCFLGVLLIVPGWHLATRGAVGKSVAAEGRVPAGFPGIPTGLGALRGFPAAVDAYLGDHLGGRDVFVSLRNRVFYFLRTPVVDRVAFGRDGWLFLRDGQVFDQVTGRRVNEQAARCLVAGMESLRDTLDASGGRLLVALIPNKHTIYGQYLPWQVPSSNGPREYDVVLKLLRERGLSTLDLRPVLAEAARRRRVYWKSDSHWNAYGALAAFNAIAAAVDRPGWAVSEEQLICGSRRETGDLARMLGVGHLTEDDVPGFCSDPSPPAVQEWGDHVQRSYRVTAGASPDSVMVLGDSFTRTYARRLLGPAVGQLVWMHHLGCQPQVEAVEAVRPDILLYLMVERFIGGCGRCVP